MISRKIYKFLHDFFTNDKKALLVTGARQIGKTYSIRHVGNQDFEVFVEINFYKKPEAIGLFNGAKDVSDVLFRLSSIADKPLIPGKTLIFFDEVQHCPEIVTWIKFLVEDGTYRYVLSGSLLGTEMKGIRSIPVGYMSIRDMYPIDFEEFVSAVGVNQDIIERLRENFTKLESVDSFVHGKMLELMKLYLIVGGMPAMVQRYLDTNDLQRVTAEQRDILRLYREDITQYDTDSRFLINDIFDMIPSELNTKNKRFILKNLNEGRKFDRMWPGFLWLSNAGVALPTFNVSELKVPLVLSKNRNLFKLFQNDVGLLACQYAQGIQTKILSGDLNINFGSIFENLAAQELTAHGFPLYYYNNKKSGELDFVIEENGKTVPIEIKSGKDYDRHNALSNVMSNPEYDIDRAYVFCNENIRTAEKICYIPIYMLMFLQNEQNQWDKKSSIFKIDIGVLGKA